jgi:hypothetical protein
VWIAYSAGILLGFAMAYLWPIILRRAVSEGRIGLENAVSACQGLAKVLVLISLGYLMMLPLLGVKLPERQYYFAGVTSLTVILVTIPLAALGVAVGLFLHYRARDVVGPVS